jgi:octaheme c-type cytochrome (tetrathionate reductase family)
MTGIGDAPLPKRGPAHVAFQAIALATMVGAVAAALSLFFPVGAARAHHPTARVHVRDVVQAQRKGHTDHQGMIRGPLPDGQSVTRACLGCHPAAGGEMLASEHFTWLGQTTEVPGTGGGGHLAPQRIGKRNLINNFCLSVESNWPRCTNCHAGYGWKDATFDFAKAENVDCLVCHEQTGTYRKGLGGDPEQGVDLVRVAGSVAAPTRENCGTCHFAGGGGDAVKHGDMDGSLFFPRERIDLHMGRFGFVCTDCHRTEKHRIPGQSLSVSVTGKSRVACAGCHGEAPHASARLNEHTRAVACSTCHIPVMAVDAPTKMIWDWSTAGQDTAVKDPHRYTKEKGSFVYAKQLAPEYAWYDGTGDRYLKGDRIDDPAGIVPINRPRGSIRDANARIWPFKVNRGKQPYDAKLQHLLVAKTYGEGGFWSDFDWDKAIRLGSEAAGIAYSGSYGFVQTEMYWPLAHMVQPGARALQCTDCHGDNGRMDWARLGYEGDPAFRGGRVRLGIVPGRQGAP